MIDIFRDGKSAWCENTFSTYISILSYVPQDSHRLYASLTHLASTHIFYVNLTQVPSTHIDYMHGPTQVPSTHVDSMNSLTQVSSTHTDTMQSLKTIISRLGMKRKPSELSDLQASLNGELQDHGETMSPKIRWTATE